LILDEMNLSELVIAAQDENPNAHRGLGKDLLCRVVMGTYQEELPERKVDKIRLKLMSFVIAHWKQVSPLLSCPAQTGRERACFRCTDVQVADCAFANPLIFQSEETATCHSLPVSKKEPVRSGKP
jgi:hypothetical protein